MWFYKQIVDVVTDAGEKFSAMVYIMYEENHLGAPSEWYFNIIVAAYDNFGFDKKVLGEALTFSAGE